MGFAWGVDLEGAQPHSRCPHMSDLSGGHRSVAHGRSETRIVPVAGDDEAKHEANQQSDDYANHLSDFHDQSLNTTAYRALHRGQIVAQLRQRLAMLLAAPPYFDVSAFPILHHHHAAPLRVSIIVLRAVLASHPFFDLRTRGETEP